MRSRVVLLHVVTGVVAQSHSSDAKQEDEEESQAYLDKIRAEFEAAGIAAETELAYGEAAKEIVTWVHEHGSTSWR